VALSLFGAAVVAAALAAVLAGRRGEFTASLRMASLWTLGLAVLLQIVGLLARSEAWNVCVRGAGATVRRRVLYRAAGVGYLASVVNGSVGVAARIAFLRRLAPDESPRVPALMAAEVPMITVEVGLAAVFSFTLIAPLGVPLWVPVLAVALVLGAVLALRRLSQRKGFWAGLGAMRTARARLVALILLAVCSQIARNWLMLHAMGINASWLDAIAVIIAMFTLGQLPIGPSLGAAATVLILGANGVAATAAAGVLLTATATVGSLSYAAWAVVDRLVGGRLPHRVAPVAVAPT
jgi:hypothetical protein